MNAETLAAAVLTLLWQAEIGEQGTFRAAGGLVLVPDGTRLEARRSADGGAAWTYRLEERRAAVRLPARIQGLQVVRIGPAPIPGLPGDGAARPADRLQVCLAGQGELHSLDLADGRLAWKTPKEDGCVLSLHDVGDIDRDGAEDVVVCGCNVAECLGGRTGAVLWRLPVTGRSLWAGPCGDLDGDGLGEVLIQAGTGLRVVSPSAGGSAHTALDVEGFLPSAAVPVDRGFVAVFPGASAWHWGADRKGRRIWEERARLRFAGRQGDRVVVVASEGVWTGPAGGPLAKADFPGDVRACSSVGDSVLWANGSGELIELPRDAAAQGAPAARTLGRFPEAPEDLSADSSSGVIVTLRGRRLSAWRLPGAPR